MLPRNFSPSQRNHGTKKGTKGAAVHAERPVVGGLRFEAVQTQELREVSGSGQNGTE